jgi:RNA polymerase sigma factor (sigma-70 family)
MDDDSLRTLIDQARHGDDASWQKLFSLCQQQLLSDAERLLGRDWPSISPRDLTQETWLKAKAAIDSYRGAGFFAWLSSIMRNVHRNLIRGGRGRATRRPLPLPSASDSDPGGAGITEPIADETGALHKLMREEDCARVQAGLDALPAELRQILRLSVEGSGLSFAEIGSRLDLTAKEVGDTAAFLSSPLGSGIG